MDIVYKFQVVQAEDCLFSTTMTFVFLLLTMSFHLSFHRQYACRLSKQLCRPVFVSYIRIRSSAHSRSLSFMLPKETRWQKRTSNVSLISFTRRLNNMGLMLHPYFSPTFEGKNSAIPLVRRTLNLFFSYMFLNKETKCVPTP